MFGIGDSKAMVGLDIGSSGIKAAELKRTRNGMTLAHAGFEPLPGELVVDSMIMDSPAVATSVNKLLSDAGIKGRAIATSVSGHSVIVKRLSVPAMSEQELDDHIHQEAAQSIPFDIADVSLDYQVLSEDGDSQTDVILVAVKKDKILNYTNVLSMAGKQTAIVDIDGFALQNCYE